jgi:hypothetical protein
MAGLSSIEGKRAAVCARGVKNQQKSQNRAGSSIMGEDKTHIREYVQARLIFQVTMARTYRTP